MVQIFLNKLGLKIKALLFIFHLLIFPKVIDHEKNVSFEISAR